ncbi:WG repeat-containing protein [Lentisphaera profundi]|uniref:WG repeat-containing protein n=1 Tax=Lentisphaera profundi TaxID=1658616 RepID=A0ABY7VU65_9BACT|nr:WG repeat-containing protein [Lentisphaera profundi]WDE96760.1 WG repeat-containing protein [Lentisphaera profundi]
MQKISLVILIFLSLSLLALEPYRGEQLWGFKDKNKVVIEEQFLEVRSFIKKLAAVRAEAGWGFVNEQGKIVLEPQADEEPQSLGDRTYYKLKGQVGMMDNAAGVLVFPAIYQSIRKFGDKLYMLKKGELWYAADHKGSFVVASGFSLVYELDDNYIAFKTDKGWGLIDHTPVIVVQAFAEKIDAPTGKMMRFKQNGLYGFLNDAGQLVIDAAYEDATEFTDSGVAFVKTGPQWDKINRQGSILNSTTSIAKETPADLVARLFKQDEKGPKVEIYNSNNYNRSYYPNAYPYVYRRGYHRPVPYKRPKYPKTSFGLGTHLYFKNGKIRGGGPSLGVSRRL